MRDGRTDGPDGQTDGQTDRQTDDRHNCYIDIDIAQQFADAR